jgi:hypothetical protein
MDTTYSYAKQQGAQTFDWYAFLSRTDLDEGDWQQAASLSAQWITCACGNLCAALPRTKSGTPLDEDLAHYGNYFHLAIESCDSGTALQILDKIEARSAYLLSQMV